jgi:hypothetical protein
MGVIAKLLNPLKRIVAVKEFIAALDSFNSTGSSEIYFTGNSPMSGFTLQVKEVGGTATSWVVKLMGSLDGVEFDTILTHTKADIGNGKPLFSGTNLYPALHYKIEVEELTLGTASSIQVKSLAVN